MFTKDIKLFKQHRQGFCKVVDDDELKKEYLTVIIDDMQDKYFERLERMDKEHNKTIKVCFTWVAILACVWTIGYFIVGNEREKRTEQRLRILEQQIERGVENNVGNN